MFFSTLPYKLLLYHLLLLTYKLSLNDVSLLTAPLLVITLSFIYVSTHKLSYINFAGVNS